MKASLQLSLIVGAVVAGTLRPAYCKSTNVLALPSGWQPYNERYAVIVMGGNENSTHFCYWGTCNAMYETLIEAYGFKPENIRFFAYQKQRNDFPQKVNGTSTVSNIKAAYQWAASVCTAGDLFYAYWVDHGNSSSISVYDGSVSHSQIGEWTKAINAKIKIGAYNPCQSGCLVDELSAEGVISITSTRCGVNNSFSWAENWWQALLAKNAEGKYICSCPTKTCATDLVCDKNSDGQIDMAEAYRWVAEVSVKHGRTNEGSIIDDNGDGKGWSWNTSMAFDPSTEGNDGYIASHYSLDGWKERDSTAEVFARKGERSGSVRWHIGRSGHRLVVFPIDPAPALGITIDLFGADGRLLAQLKPTIRPDGHSFDVRVPEKLIYGALRIAVCRVQTQEYIIHGIGLCR